MLRFLRIRRLAIIESAAVDFGPGFNVLTGETGAGKSILIEAVGLLLGGRASGELVRTGDDVATIEAVFDRGGEEILIRREITSQGRSRGFINGELSTSAALKHSSSRLIELHGQHEHQTLLDPASHLAMLDAYGEHSGLLASVGAAYGRLQKARAALAEGRRAADERGNRLDLLTFQAGELERAQLTAGEDDELLATRQVLASAERVERLCHEGYQALYEREQSVLAALGGVWRRLEELAGLDPAFRPYLGDGATIKAQLEDLAMFLRRYASSMETSPARLQQVEDRLALLERLKRKYGPTLGDAIARRDALRQELDDLEQGDLRVAALERELDEARTTYQGSARALSEARRALARPFCAAVEEVLAGLAMEGTRLEVQFGDTKREDEWTATGFDQAEFEVSTNTGEDLRPLARIASGGELSRMMLAMKALTASRRARSSLDAADVQPDPALIFDEVDAGIGGRVADAVGETLRALASSFQVLCITHLPQIAAHADHHFRIEKSVSDGRTGTTVTELDRPGRVEELARMLGGSDLSDAIRQSARDMLDARNGGAKGEMKPKGESERRRNRRAGRAARGVS
jgi:DNA repair protein RecN (Recombination protein N)